MVDNTQLALLKKGPTDWNVWRAAHASIRPDLSHAGLCGLDLNHANLAGADLRRADLRGAWLRGANLVGADLERADLFKAELDGADLAGANLVGAHVQCHQLTTARNWQSALRGPELACGGPLPSRNAD